MTVARFLMPLACMILALGSVSPAVAQQARNRAQSELTDLFTTFCLTKFPDEGAAGQYAAAKGARTMPEDKLHAILGDDPGSGWLYETAFGTYALTIKQSPSHDCTISNRLDEVADIKDAFGTTLSLWVGTRRMGKLGVFPPSEQEISGQKAQVYQWQLTRTDGSKETLTALLIPAPNAETEIRLARSIPIPDQ